MNNNNIYYSQQIVSEATNPPSIALCVSICVFDALHVGNLSKSNIPFVHPHSAHSIRGLEYANKSTLGQNVIRDRNINGAFTSQLEHIDTQYKLAGWLHPHNMAEQWRHWAHFQPQAEIK